MTILGIVITLALVAMITAVYINQGVKKSNHDQFIVGVGLFPDALPLILAGRRGYFYPLNVKILFLDWSIAPKYLVEEKCHLILSSVHMPSG